MTKKQKKSYAVFKKNMRDLQNFVFNNMPKRKLSKRRAKCLEEFCRLTSTAEAYASFALDSTPKSNGENE